jgi:hypothetical protein
MKICASMRASSWRKIGRMASSPPAFAGQAFEVPERLFDAGELEVQAPQPRRIIVGEIGAQQIPPLAPPGLAQLGAIKAVAERGAIRGDGESHRHVPN